MPIDQIKTVEQRLKTGNFQKVEMYPLMIGTRLFPRPGTERA